MKSLTTLFLSYCATVEGFESLFPAPPHTAQRYQQGLDRLKSIRSTGSLKSSNYEWSDFDGYIGGDDSSNDAFELAKIFQNRVRPADLTGCQTRQFSLGQDLILTDYVGNMGFDEVTDWEYYYQNEEDPDDRMVVQPNPFDSDKPKRTRTRSGSVVRLFRGEFVGPLGGSLSAQARDRRVLVKEFTGNLALQLATAELQAIGMLQSDLVAASGIETAKAGVWVETASARSVKARQDNLNLVQLLGLLGKAPYLGILGEVNLAELDDSLDANEFYRALGVPPPKPGAVWVVYEYAGLSTLQAYAEPAEVRRSKQPPKKGFFGNVIEPPTVPAFSDRANYVKAILKRAIESVATAHECGLVHRSIGLSSTILSSTTMDKREAASVYATMTDRLLVKLSDFGFSTAQKDASLDDEFRARARTFGIRIQKGENSVVSSNFAMAEDMHALGFAFLRLLLSSLAQVPSTDYSMPATDEDTLQRLFDNIFERDVQQFREYVEAEDVWSDLVQLLDDKDGAGWKVLETLLKAREKAAKNLSSTQLFTIRGLLSNPFFA